MSVSVRWGNKIKFSWVRTWQVFAELVTIVIWYCSAITSLLHMCPCMVPREIYNTFPLCVCVDHFFSWRGTYTSCVIYRISIAAGPAGPAFAGPIISSAVKKN